MNDPWWRTPAGELASSLGSSLNGLSSGQAALALQKWGRNEIAPEGARHVAVDLLLRLRNPLLVLLIVAAVISAATGDAFSAALILAMLVASVGLDFVQERRAGHAVEKLRALVRSTTRVRRGGREIEVACAAVVPGDVVLVSAGDLVPADGVVLAASRLCVNQAAITGEGYPAEKRPCAAPCEAEAATDAPGVLLSGTHVASGSGEMLVVRTGAASQMGEVAALVAARRRPNPLEAGTRRFGLMILRLTLLLVLFVLLVNALLARPMLESFMFAVALAVGLTPELLPMIVSVTLARGATRLAAEEVIVKHPSALYSLGAMDTLCTDKTGTLTEGRIELDRALDIAGRECSRVLLLARVNSEHSTGMRSPLDEAILRRPGKDLREWRKLDEVPFDFERRRSSVLVQAPGGGPMLIAKGAPESLIGLCTRFEDADGRVLPLDSPARARAEALAASLGDEGLRALAICWRDRAEEVACACVEDERGLVLAGFAVFRDPPRAGSAEALSALAAKGVAIKILTGDNDRVALHLCRSLGLQVTCVMSGRDIEPLEADALGAAAERANVFCRVSPVQKTRLIEALRARGRVVGFLGDGINDAPALRAADVGISVDSAAAVAREAADVILMRHHLAEVVVGVAEGRRSYANVMKYLRMGTSSNFGNMMSMAGATLFLPFLPLLPVQVLLNNLLYDLSETALPLDRVEEAELAQPKAWDVEGIRRFMLVFGPLSSLFDFVTFGLLFWRADAGPALFRTGWFIESVASQVLVIFAIRTARPAWRGRPHALLVASALGAVATAVILPFLPVSGLLGFVAPPWTLLAALAVVVSAYLWFVEALKPRVLRAV